MISAPTEVVPLRAAGDSGRFGGKASGLSKALAAGLPVPDGVALAASFGARFLDANGATRQTLLDGLGPLPFPLAVRSSAADEDGREVSFAGQHLSRLNACDPGQLGEAIAAVVSSGRSEGAASYRKHLGVSTGAKMGVVLQQLVLADVSGVLFTRNPTTGANEVVIEAAFGLGEAIVAGLVDPDFFRLEPSGRLLERRIGHKDLSVRATPGGGTSEQDNPDADAPSLGDEQLGQLCRLARRCQELAGEALDLEWAFRGPELFLLQVRPITAYAPGVSR